MNKIIIVPVSGGKDSTACLVKAILTCGINNVIAVFNDTGWEHPITYDYIQYLSKELNIKIHVTHGTKNGKDILSILKWRKKFPTSRARFCTQQLKQIPLRDFIYSTITYDNSYEVWLGMRADESIQRKNKYGDIKEDDIFDLDLITKGVYRKKVKNIVKARLPIVEWSTTDVFDYLTKNNIKANALYALGDNRVGCYPCLISSKSAMLKVANTEFGKERFLIIKRLEDELKIKFNGYDTESTCNLCNI